MHLRTPLPQTLTKGKDTHCVHAEALLWHEDSDPSATELSPKEI